MAVPNPQRTVTLGTEGGHITQVVIDGFDIAHHVTGLTLIGRPREAELHLTLKMPYLGDTPNVQATVKVDDATAIILNHLGWTPPAEPEAHTEPEPEDHGTVVLELGEQAPAGQEG